MVHTDLETFFSFLGFDFWAVLNILGVKLPCFLVCYKFVVLEQKKKVCVILLNGWQQHF